MNNQDSSNNSVASTPTLEAKEKASQSPHILLSSYAKDSSVAADNISLGGSDSSSIDSSLNEAQNDSSSHNFLKIDSKGVSGLCERIPLGFKLCFITTFASLIMTIFATWLLVTRCIQLSDAMKVDSFSHEYATVSSLVNSLQKERGAYAAYSVTPSTSNLSAYRKAITESETALQTFTTAHKNEITADITKGFSDLAALRTQVTAGSSTATPLSSFELYSTNVNNLFAVIAKLAKQTGNQNVVMVHGLFLQLREAAGRLRSFGTIAFSNLNTTLMPKIADQFHDYVEQRKSIIHVYNSLSSDAHVKMLNDLVFSLPDYAWVLQQEDRVILQANGTNLNQLVDAKLWSEKMTNLVNGYQTMFTNLLDEINNDNDKSIRQSIAFAIGIIIVSVVFMVIFALLSFCLSRTIIGPWVRMNKLQDEVMHKFVPRNFLRLINVDRITSVKLGNSASKDLVMMKISIYKFWHLVEDMNLQAKIDMFNRIISTISPVIRNHGGYIDSYFADEILVLFRAPQGVISCANKIHKAISTFNSSNEYAKLELCIVVHAAQNVHMSVCGDEGRMQGVVLSKITKEVRQMSNIARRFKCKTVFSNAVLDMSGEKRKDSQLIAMTSTMILYETIQGDSEAKQKKELYSKAIRSLFVEHNVYDALNILSTFTTESSKFYVRVCKNIIESLRNEIAGLSVEEMLSKRELDSVFDYACQKERSSENLNTFRNVKTFKAAFKSGDVGLQKSMVLAIQAELNNINITENLKKVLIVELQKPQETWTEGMLEPLEAELFLLLTDTFKRMKNTDEFKRNYCKQRELNSELLEEMLLSTNM